MIGQFTFIDGAGIPHTAALDYGLKWISSERDLRDLLNDQFRGQPGDSGPEAGNIPGLELLHRAAAAFKATNVLILAQAVQQPTGTVN
jgi:hypothetical protein